MTKSVAFANAVLNLARNISASPYAATYLSLHTGNPGATGASEVSAPEYGRIQEEVIAWHERAIHVVVAARRALPWAW